MVWLKNQQDEYYSLVNPSGITSDKKEALAFATVDEAKRWLDLHAFHSVPLRDLGFRMVQSKQ